MMFRLSASLLSIGSSYTFLERSLGKGFELVAARSGRFGLVRPFAAHPYA
jgi:hypothetical protein